MRLPSWFTFFALLSFTISLRSGVLSGSVSLFQLGGLARVALKSSSTSTTIDEISWMAKMSSALLFWRSSHSGDCLPQLSASLAANTPSATNDLFVSVSRPLSPPPCHPSRSVRTVCSRSSPSNWQSPLLTLQRLHSTIHHIILDRRRSSFGHPFSWAVRHVSRHVTLLYELCLLPGVATLRVRQTRAVSAELTPPSHCDALVSARSWLTRRAFHSSSTC